MRNAFPHTSGYGYENFLDALCACKIDFNKFGDMLTLEIYVLDC